MSKEYYFWGVTNNEEVWKVLHDHFKKLASQDDAGDTEIEFSERKATRRK